jgi:hypothetical protein
MAFEKGKSGNPQGRPKGSMNEKTAYIRDWIVSLIGSNAQSMMNDFNRLPLKERWRVITQLMPYVLPKQTEAKISGQLDFNSLTDAQLDEVIKSIADKITSEENQ